MFKKLDGFAIDAEDAEVQHEEKNILNDDPKVMSGAPEAAAKKALAEPKSAPEVHPDHKKAVEEVVKDINQRQSLMQSQAQNIQSQSAEDSQIEEI